MNIHTRKKFKKGSYLYIEGDEDVGEIYIIQDGEIILEFINKNVIRYRQSAGPGDILGFISSLSDRPRMESAILKTDSTILVFNRENFLILLNKNADIAMKVINTFAEELRAYDNLIFSLKRKKEIIPRDIQLFNLGSFFHDKGEINHAYYVFTQLLNLFPNSIKSEDARSLMQAMEAQGIRNILEPIKQGIELVFTNNQIVFCENESGDALYLIKEGKIRIYKNYGKSQIMLSILKIGDIFGELAIISNKPRNATAISDGTTVLIPITMENFIRMYQKSPTVLKRIYTSISERLWFTFIRTESRLYERPLTRIYSFFENKLHEEKISLKSTKSYIFNFGIDELLKMTDLTQDQLGGSLDELLQDHNLSFNFGEIGIDRPCEVAAKAKYYKSRDKLSGSDIPEVENQSKQYQVENVALPKENIGNKKDKISESSILFSELSEDIFDE